jgi:opacity protein-like surface antigen
MGKWHAKFLLGVAVVLLFSYSQVSGSMSIGARAGFSGYSAGDWSESAPVFGGYIEYTLPMVGVGIRGSVDYWSKTYTFEGFDEEWDVTFSDITIGATGTYRFPLMGSPVTPYVGAGAGLHLLKSEDPDSSVTESKFGIHGIGGAEFMITPMIGVFAEGGYGMVFTEDESTNIWAVCGGVFYRLEM